MQTRIIRLLLLASCWMFAIQAHAGSILYQNGPVNGICDINGCTADAWTINFGFEITDSFTISTPSTIQGFNIAVWLDPGDTLSSVDWAIGTTAFGTQIANGTASGANVSSTFLFTNQYGFNIYEASITGLDVHVTGGAPQSYWLSLQNATVPSGDPVYWDENSGPSFAQGNCLKDEMGCIPSESFNIVGTPDGGTTPEPSTILLVVSGMIGVGGALRRKRL